MAAIGYNVKIFVYKCSIKKILFLEDCTQLSAGLAQSDLVGDGHRVHDYESSRIGWVPLAGVPALIGRGEISSGTAHAAQLYAITRP
jgi:hypothetical protein